MMKKSSSIDEYILQHEKYADLLNKLRAILLDTSLDETIKWGMPTYTFQNKNLVGIGAFKNHVGLWFFQGALLKDSYKMLKNAQEGKTKAMRQIQFDNQQIIDKEMILEYVQESIDNQKSGLVIKPEKNKTKLVIPEELTDCFEKETDLQSNFNELSLGKRREYVVYIESAKRADTKLNRVEKIIPLIMSKKGLYDKYK